MWLKTKFNTFIAILFSITLYAVIGHEHILRSVISITPQSENIANAYGDNENGGNSIVTRSDRDDYYQWHCQLMPTITYPYCGFDISLAKEWPRGIDFTQYSKIKLWLEYDGEGETVRLSLKNFNKEYSHIDSVDSTKFNELEIRKEHLHDGVEINLRNFIVPTWWKLKHKLQINDNAPEFNNIVFISFETGTNLKEGKHLFKFKRIDIIGQWMSTESWYFSFILLWLTVGVIWIIYAYISLKKKVSLGKKREEELLEINSLLDNRTQELTKQTQRDVLTGAFNRQGVEDAISRALIEWQDNKQPLSIIMLDIDNFKQVNDAHGHDVGDDVLTSLTQLVQSNIRTSDRFARWGGEEFVLVCRNTPIQQACHLAENLRKLIASANIKGIGITASFGVANIKNSGSIKTLFKQADEALYRAKHNGRNKVEF